MAEMQAGNITIDPFNYMQLGTNSYDCRLGKFYYTSNRLKMNFSPYRAGETEDFWQGPFEAKPDANGVAWIAIPPGQTILAHTHEYIGGRRVVTASMRTRSTMARSCLDVCGSAGLGDVGYISRWTMEIQNKTPDKWIHLPVGIRICQLEFHYVGETIKAYSGKYGQGTWQPSDMLPKAHKDYDNPLTELAPRKSANPRSTIRLQNATVEVSADGIHWQDITARMQGPE